MATIDRYLGKEFCGDAPDLLRMMPVESVDAVITDAMYGTSRSCVYEWGPDPAQGDPVRHWQYHEPPYRECLRVLKPAGILAWGQGFKFVRHLDDWFGPHRVWSPLCVAHGLNVFPNVWVVQSRKRQPIEHPNDMIVEVDRNLFVPLKKLHPCPQPVEELEFMVRCLTEPGQVCAGLLLRPRFHAVGRQAAWPALDRLRPQPGVLPVGHEAAAPDPVAEAGCRMMPVGNEVRLASNL